MHLTKYLKIHGLTRLKFAKILNISPTHMSDICNEKKTPSLSLGRRIIRATKGEVGIDDLLRNNDE